MDIDFIITWVDGNDPQWIEEKNKYVSDEKSDSRDCRYRTWDILRYGFRSIEKFAPWVNNVFFVTCGHYPKWLNLDHPKLKFVKHEDYIPKEWLPTFSSRTIDCNFHRIKDLSEHFVYFNDDMLLLRPVSPIDFFDKKGLPRETGILVAYAPPNVSYLSLCADIALLRKNFDREECVRKNIGKWFSYRYGVLNFLNLAMLMVSRGWTGFKVPHMPYSYLKSTYADVWDKEGEILDIACSHRFRNDSDVNHLLFSYWQMASGNFSPRAEHTYKYFSIDDQCLDEVVGSITNRKYKMICINDSKDYIDQQKIDQSVRDALERILPEKSQFEI